MCPTKGDTLTADASKPKWQLMRPAWRLADASLFLDHVAWQTPTLLNSLAGSSCTQWLGCLFDCVSGLFGCVNGLFGCVSRLFELI
ncbi:hypothetical protein HanIR_Chr06g0277591 [Helianthus annuus]|nr:hypothetical protein HanIR_Chr06g0277591 [Helianthus annuus]